MASVYYRFKYSNVCILTINDISVQLSLYRGREIVEILKIWKLIYNYIILHSLYSNSICSKKILKNKILYIYMYIYSFIFCAINSYIGMNFLNRCIPFCIIILILSKFFIFKVRQLRFLILNFLFFLFLDNWRQSNRRNSYR